MNSPSLKSWVWAAAGASIVAIISVLYFCDPVRVPIYPRCVFHQVTGLDCPGCGCLRAMHALLHGDVLTALRFNAFLVLSLPLFAMAGVRYLKQRNEGAAFPVKPSWLWIYFGAFLTFGILRMLPNSGLATFAP